MEKFRRKLRLRLILLSLILGITGCIYAVFLLSRDQLPEIPDFIMGYQFGLFIGLEIVLVFFVAKYLATIKNEEELKKLYIKENDERNIMILQKTGSLILPLYGIGLGIITMIAGFINTTVFFSLLGALVLLAIAKITLKVYFNKKY